MPQRTYFIVNEVSRQVEYINDTIVKDEMEVSLTFVHNPKSDPTSPDFVSERFNVTLPAFGVFKDVKHGDIIDVSIRQRDSA